MSLGCGLVKRTQLLRAIAGKTAALLQVCVEVPRSLPSTSDEHDAAAARGRRASRGRGRRLRTSPRGELHVRRVRGARFDVLLEVGCPLATILFAEMMVSTLFFLTASFTFPLWRDLYLATSCSTRSPSFSTALMSALMLLVIAECCESSTKLH